MSLALPCAPDWLRLPNDGSFHLLVCVVSLAVTMASRWMGGGRVVEIVAVEGAVGVMEEAEHEEATEEARSGDVDAGGGGGGVSSRKN